MKSTYFCGIVWLLVSNCLAADTLSEYSKCGKSKEARKLAKLIMEDRYQKRLKIECNAKLSQIAEDKALTMMDYGLVMHNLGGSPNERLREANFELPDYYGTGFNSNQVEAIAGGYSNAEEVWDGFLGSNSHKTHLLGEHEFYLEQDQLGVAFVKKWETPHVEYWVVYLTKGKEKEQVSPVEENNIPNKGFKVIQK